MAAANEYQLTFQSYSPLESLSLSLSLIALTNNEAMFSNQFQEYICYKMN